jgi:hypothetical protein
MCSAWFADWMNVSVFLVFSVVSMQTEHNVKAIISVEAVMAQMSGEGVFVLTWIVHGGEWSASRTGRSVP